MVILNWLPRSLNVHFTPSEAIRDILEIGPTLDWFDLITLFIFFTLANSIDHFYVKLLPSELVDSDDHHSSILESLGLQVEVQIEPNDHQEKQDDYS